jgi:transposase
VNPICAAAFIAVIGNTNRFMTSRKLVAYLGLDPRIKQSGEAPARAGGSQNAARRPRGGRSLAVVATARKLAALFWCMLKIE